MVAISFITAMFCGVCALLCFIDENYAGFAVCSICFIANLFYVAIKLVG